MSFNAQCTFNMGRMFIVLRFHSSFFRHTNQPTTTKPLNGLMFRMNTYVIIYSDGDIPNDNVSNTDMCTKVRFDNHEGFLLI